jgi:4'-phosphopantetheinyl transferase EntD
MSRRVDPADPSTALDELFPPGAASVLSLAAGDGALTDDEARATVSFAPVRLAEFRHGRECARRALARLGAGPSGIPVGPDREPLWPTGIVGSISHAGAAAAAVVARETGIVALGLDLESERPLEPELHARICLPDELRRARASGMPPGHAEKLLFSIKEAAYKALWPALRRFLDFHDLEVFVDHPAARFTILSRSVHCPPALAAAIEGRFALLGGLLAAGAGIRRRGA